jgi:hypothetical protein
MATQRQLSWVEAKEWQVQPATEKPDSSLEVVVLHTTTPGTLRALQEAARLANGLAAQIRLLVLQAVPYPLPLDEPPVPLEFTRSRFRAVASDVPVKTQVDIRIGRDRRRMLESILQPRSVVVLGDRPGWWPSEQKRLVKWLTGQGHQVVFACSKKG